MFAAAQFLIGGRWTSDDVVRLVNCVQTSDLPFFFVASHALRNLGSRTAVPDGKNVWHSSGWEFIRLPAEERDIRNAVSRVVHTTTFRGAMTGERTELKMLTIPRGAKRKFFPPSPGGSCEPSDCTVLVLSECGFTEITFAGEYLEAASDIDDWIATGAFEEHLMDVTHLFRRMIPEVKPDLGYIGQLGIGGSDRERARALAELGLPGSSLQWTTYFGPRYVGSLGRDFLLGAPAFLVEELSDGGVLYRATENFIVFPGYRPSRSQIQSYFRKSPRLRALSYSPVEARRVMTKKAYAEALRNQAS